MQISFTSHQGKTVTKSFAGFDQLRARLSVLEEVEAETVRFAPTDSGPVRRNYQAEAAAIRGALAGKPTECPLTQSDIMTALIQGAFKPMDDSTAQAFAGIEYTGYIWQPKHLQDTVVVADHGPGGIVFQVVAPSGATWQWEVDGSAGIIKIAQEV